MPETPRRRRRPASTPPAPGAARSYLDPESGAFVIEGYHWAPPLSNFLPGIAGLWGIPLWLYYVNRGQAVSSLGVRDKDGQILEFQSFNQACARVEREGFRTFLKLDGGPVHEPFRKTDRRDVLQTLEVHPGEVRVRERHLGLEVEVEVAYVPLPGLPVAALARDVRVRNLARRARRLEWLDGAARILPYGIDQKTIKSIPRHIEAMFGVTLRGGVPIFRLKQTAADSERVGAVTGGNFYAPVGGGRVVVDPEAVFGAPFELDRPWTFEAGGAAAVGAAREVRENKTACAMALREERLPPGGAARLSALMGYVRRDEDLDALLAEAARPGFVDRKRAENARVVGEIGQRSFTASASPAFDAYARQNFLDNVIRGGMPLVLETAGGPSAFYVYSRQNGDLERDYHFFVLEPTFLSQGNGHYRSVLQNRRTDAWFFPEVEDANLVTFLGLIQTDGYNPLEVGTLSYRVPEAGAAALERALRPLVRAASKRRALAAALRRPFTPGEAIHAIEAARGSPLEDREAALRAVLAPALENEVGGLHEGFWADHWHYNFDTLEVVLMVYPDRLRELLLERRVYTWFDDPDVVLPRDERTVDAGGGRIRAYGAVARDPEKARRIASRKEDAHRVRTRGGSGEVHRTHLAAKLLTLVATRLATLDPAGLGVEMEAGKPGWNDSMNGLPALFGSGLSETLELARAVGFLDLALGRLAGAPGIALPEELAALLRALGAAVERRLASRAKDAALRYWEDAGALKERYRERTRHGITGKETALPLREVRAILGAAGRLLERALAGRGARSPEGVPYTYFVNEVTRAEPLGRTGRQGLPLVRAKAFRSRPVRLFLEGPVHWLKARPADARAVYDAVRRSPLYDGKLGMYKACEDMSGESPELGRAVGAYPRGWIENESIYLHMEYKWLLEVLRSGLAAELWRDARTALVPFMDPAVYGRSTLEGASFVVSSAYADPTLHGRAFQPRLSGLTCEFIHLWILAVAGPAPLCLDAAGRLELCLDPSLPGWLFTGAASRRPYHDPVDGWGEVAIPAAAFAFKLFGGTLVVYHNPERGDTFGPRAARPRRLRFAYRDGRKADLAAATAPEAHARAVRAGLVRRIDVTLGRDR